MTLQQPANPTSTGIIIHVHIYTTLHRQHLPQRQHSTIDIATKTALDFEHNMGMLATRYNSSQMTLQQSAHLTSTCTTPHIYTIHIATTTATVYIEQLQYSAI